MFTGIIRDMGVIQSAEQQGDLRVVIGTRLDLSKTEIGASICCSGVCLTVVQKGSGWFAVDLSRETVGKSASCLWMKDARINLELSLHIGDEIGGHFVSGHVDGVCVVNTVTATGSSHVLEIEAPEHLAKFIAPKGSVTLDGVSLTVNEVRGPIFTVNIIPHTWEKTTLGLVEAGSNLNIEIDMLARYVARLMEKDAA